MEDSLRKNKKDSCEKFCEHLIRNESTDGLAEYSGRNYFDYLLEMKNVDNPDYGMAFMMI